MKHLLTLSTLVVGLLISAGMSAQNNFGLGTTTPDPSAMLEVTSTTQGVLVPRLSSLQRTAIPAPANGLLVFDTDVSCFFFFTTGAWTNLCSASVGPQGPQGPQGSQGPAGADGVDGAPGVNGINGADGVDGIDGIDGINGNQGPAGADGIDGAPGVNGINGADGVDGINGIDGATGATGPNWSINSMTYNPNGTLTVNTSQPAAVSTTGSAWLIGGNALTGTGNLGTTSNNHIDLISNNIVRGRLSNLGEFFIGTTNTTLAGDLVNGVSNAVFPWALNGYSANNGSGVYGAIQANTNTQFAGVQGESDALNGTAPGVRGLGLKLTLNGVNGARAGTGANTGWGGLFQNDLGYTGIFAVASDARLKKNIATINDPLKLVMKLRGVTYEHRLDDPNYSDLGLKQGLAYGFIAQEVETVLPELVFEKLIPHINSSQRSRAESKPAELLKTVSYIEMIPILLEAIKQQQVQLEQLQNQLNSLEK